MQIPKQDHIQINRYGTKKDARLVVLIMLVLTLPLILGLILLFFQPKNVDRPFIGGILTILAGIICWAVFFTRIYPSYYETTSSALNIRSGLSRKVIPLTSIQKIYPPRVVLNAVWSFDQLRVDYRLPHQSFLHTVFVAPEDKIAFLQDLAERETNLEIVDGILIRRK